MAANRLNPYVLDDFKDRWGLGEDRNNRQVAVKLGIDTRTLDGYLDGTVDPPLKILLQLRARTGWPLDGLVIEASTSEVA